MRQVEAVQDALNAPLPEIRTNGTWSKDCAPCVGQGGIAQPEFSSRAQEVRPPLLCRTQSLCYNQDI